MPLKGDLVRPLQHHVLEAVMSAEALLEKRRRLQHAGLALQVDAALSNLNGLQFHEDLFAKLAQFIRRRSR